MMGTSDDGLIAVWAVAADFRQLTPTTSRSIPEWHLDEPSIPPPSILGRVTAQCSTFDWNPCLRVAL